MENSPPAKPLLEWRDLDANDVYYIAHAEHDMRTAVAQKLSRLAFTDDPHERLRITEGAERLMASQETRSASWLADQAALCGLATAKPQPYRLLPRREEFAPRPPQPPVAPRYINLWLDGLMTAHGLSSRGLAKHCGVSHTHINQLRNGERTAPTLEVMRKLARAFADLEHLDGAEYDAFVTSAFEQNGYR